MADFEEFDDFHENEIQAQGRKVQIYRNGNFTDPKMMFVQHHWMWDEFLCAASQRLEMIPTANRVFNADGNEINDVMAIEENDYLFFSTGAPFQIPASSNTTLTNGNGDEEEMNSNSSIPNEGIVGGYIIQNVLGRGGFGEVRLGIHQLTKEKVALKFILKTEMGTLGDAERTNIEIQCLTALNHPNIMKLVRALNEPNHVVLVLELLEGGDLYHYLRDGERDGLPEDQALILFTQILSAVSYAHNQHICHRDLKLENILLANKDDISVIKVADFGLSDFYKPGAMIKTSCGSISYLAPEVFRGTCNAGPPLDIWSLGVILYAILTNRLPFENMDLRDSGRPKESIIRQHILNAEYEIPSTISESAIDLIKNMLNPDPKERATISDIFIHSWMREKNSLIEMNETKEEEELNLEEKEKKKHEEMMKEEEEEGKEEHHEISSMEETSHNSMNENNLVIDTNGNKEIDEMDLLDKSKTPKHLHSLTRQSSCMSSFPKHTVNTTPSSHSPTRHRQYKDNATSGSPPLVSSPKGMNSTKQAKNTNDVLLPKPTNHGTNPLPVASPNVISASKGTQNLLMPALARAGTTVLHDDKIAPNSSKHKAPGLQYKNDIRPKKDTDEILPRPRKASIE